MSRKTYGPVKHTTYLECLDEIPPPYCRLIAREKTRGGTFARMLTVPEIARAAGLTWQRVAAIARRKSFVDVTLGDADKFRLGCGITVQNERLHKEFIKRNFQRPGGFTRYLSYAKKSYGPSGKQPFIDRILKRL